MKLQHLDFVEALIVDLVYAPGTLDNQHVRQGRPAEVQWSEDANGFLLTQGEVTTLANCRAPSDDRALRHLCASGRPCLAWVPSIQTTGLVGFTLQVHSFPASLVISSLDVAFDDVALEAAKKLNPTIRSANDLAGWLHDQCILETTWHDREASFSFISAGEETNEELPGSFVLHGKSIRAVVHRVEHPTVPGHVHCIKKITRTKGRARRPLHLVEGAVKFNDKLTQAAIVRTDWRAQWDELSAMGSFLKKWYRYGELEVDDLLQKSATIDAIDYHGFEVVENGTRFDVVAGPNATHFAALVADQHLVEKAELAVWPTRPDHLDLPEDAPVEDRLGEERPPFMGTVEAITEHSIVLRGVLDNPPSYGVLTLTTGGDRERFKRRTRAQQAIKNGTAKMPQLGFLIEGKSVARVRAGSIPPLTPAIQEKLFSKAPPTPSQTDAIRVALNTPDIALIQGPPGTGKTTVIRAILERLNELSDGEGAFSGQFLLSGYQHDAVENAVGRIDINGLPPIKFGARSGEDDTTLQETLIRIDAWRDERAANLRQREAGVALTDAQRHLEIILEDYLLAPGPPANAAQKLREAGRVAVDVLTSDLLDRMRELALALEQRYEQDDLAATRQRLCRAARALRSAPIPYNDDGALNAARFLALAGRSEHGVTLSATEAEVLERLAQAVPDTPAFWEQASTVRAGLVQRLAPRSAALGRQPVLFSEVVELLGEARDLLDARRRASLDGADMAVADFLDALENAPDEIRQAIIAYTPVFAATCQQSVQKALAEAKAAEEGEYDTVIVDEAARANPLDLFIPLANAKRRIILVGDHRQLPHIIEKRLAEQLENELRFGEDGAGPGEPIDVQEEIKRSLFEHLFQDALRREAAGEPQRAVTLDAQFRMHPALGKLISEQFYEANGEPEIRSPLPAHLFQHALPGLEGAAAVWLDVREGDEYRDPKTRSWKRTSEAAVIAKTIKGLIDSETGRHLNFGVISFYSDQVTQIGLEFHKQGLMDPTASGKSFIARAPYRIHVDEKGKPSGEARLRLGTVDAFQGREFDVVFLSVVRSNTRPDATQEQRQGKYGHLMSSNRLNVAMSRQKRLLVAVGDLALTRAPHAKDAIGPLVAFAALTQQRPLGRFGTYEQLF